MNAQNPQRAGATTTVEAISVDTARAVPHQVIAASPSAHVAVSNRQNKPDAAQAQHTQSSADAPADIAAITGWLVWQCQMVTGVISGAVFTPGKTVASCNVLASWPAATPAPLLPGAAAQAAGENRQLVLARQLCEGESGKICDLLCVPVYHAQTQIAVVAVMMSTRPPPQQRAVLQLIEWGSIWLMRLMRGEVGKPSHDSRWLLHVMAQCIGARDALELGRKAVQLIGAHIPCQRASIGRREGLRVDLQCVSDLRDFDRRRHFTKRIEAAMQESLDRKSAVQFPGADASGPLMHAHQALAEHGKRAQVFTFPLSNKTDLVGALTIEADETQPLDEPAIALCREVAALLGPLLAARVHHERSLVGRTVDAATSGLFGRKWLRGKILVAVAATLLVVAAVTPGNYRVTSPARLEATVRQAVTAPIDGYVQSASARAGDVVEAGAVLATLDTQELNLTRDKWLSERAQQASAYQEALATRDRAGVTRLRARLQQVDAELALIDTQLQRTRLTAPFAGVVVSGDLSQALAAPVKLGQVLFEVAPLTGYRVILEVPEHGVAGIEAGQPGRLVLTALPRQPMDLVIKQVIPVAVSGDSRTWFRVEAELSTPGPALRPGMRGIAKISVGERSLMWIWGHALVDRLRLLLWSIGF